MKQLDFRAASLSTEEKVDAKTNPSQTTEIQIIYVPSMGNWDRRYQIIPDGEMGSIFLF